MEWDVTESVEAFRELLAAGWPIVKRASFQDISGSFVNDWLQANWERIVEASFPPDLGVALEVYGSGADCNVKSSRVWQPERLPTMAVYLRYLGNEPLMNLIDGSELSEPLRLQEFCTLRDGWPVVDVPFDHILLERAELTVVRADQLRYYADRTT